MKSSLAHTFQDAAAEKESEDRIFKSRKTVRKITDEAGSEVEGQRVVVVEPYDETLNVTEQTSTLLLEPRLKKEYDDLLRATAEAKTSLLTAIQVQSGNSKQNLEAEISRAFTSSDSRFDDAMVRIKMEVQDVKDHIFSSIEYDKIFNPKVLVALNTKDLKSAIKEYADRYNELLEASTYFKRGTFDYYNADQISKSLSSNGFFKAKHTLSLNAEVGNREIVDEKELKDVIAKEKEAILTDKKLRDKFDDVGKRLQRNTELRTFYEYVRGDEALLSRLDNPEELREDVLKSYLKVHEELYVEWFNRYETAKQRRKDLENQAQEQRTQWERVIEIFNERFTVPFRLEARNKADVLLGQTSIIDLAFTYIDGTEEVDIDRPSLLKSLSMGERKALYVLNVIFQIETRIKKKEETLVVVDDIADSFDYQNKYAIIQYLKDICDQGDGLFKMLVMTHNFDFFRTIESRFVGYTNCLMASKNEDGITLAKAEGIRNVFAKDWKKNFYKDDKKKIASIPFLRNLIEMTIGEEDYRYVELTAMLHWKDGSDAVSVGKLDEIYNELCKTKGASTNPKNLIHELIVDEADKCLEANAGVNLHNKIVLAIAIRLVAEKLMIRRIEDQKFVANIVANQAHDLVDKFKEKFPQEIETIAILDQVTLMTPENIHVNSFMYEPIIDMSDDSLKKLYRRVKGLQ